MASTDSRDYFHKPSFYKVITADGMMIKLPIPPDFNEHIDDIESSKVATLTIPSGNKEWRVGLCKEADGNLYFKDGFAKFSRDNSLEKQDVLFFHYNGNFNFTVAKD